MSLSRRSAAVLLALALGVTLVTGGVASTAAAQDDSEFTSVLGVDGEQGTTIARAAFFGSLDRFGFWLGQQTPDFVADAMGQTDPPTASGQADAVQSYYNSHNQTFLSYANERKDWSSNRTVKVTWTISEETATRYVVADAANGSLTRTRMVTATNRTVGDEVHLCGYAARQSRAELETFYDKFAEPNKNVTAAYVGKLKGKYNNDVSTTLIQSRNECDGGAL